MKSAVTRNRLQALDSPSSTKTGCYRFNETLFTQSSAHPLGLLNFARLLEHCQTPCLFWLMPDWESLLTTYGNPDIWNRPKNLEDFHNAKRRLASQPAANTLFPLMDAMQTKGLALEQEALWLQPSCP